METDYFQKATESLESIDLRTVAPADAQLFCSSALLRAAAATIAEEIRQDCRISLFVDNGWTAVDITSQDIALNRRLRPLGQQVFDVSIEISELVRSGQVAKARKHISRALASTALTTFRLLRGE